MVEYGNHNPNVVGSNPTIIIYFNTEDSIVWFNASVLGTEDQRFESFSSDKFLIILYEYFKLSYC